MLLKKIIKNEFSYFYDNVRQGLNQDLGFTDVDRVENIRRIGDAGLIVIVAKQNWQVK